MKYKIETTSSFKKDLKRILKRNLKISLLQEVVVLLQEGKNLPQKFHDHLLSGNWKNHRECHILPDWLLIYRIEKDILVLTLTRTGTHSDLLE